jgi:hypothetical protein
MKFPAFTGPRSLSPFPQKPAIEIEGTKGINQNYIKRSLFLGVFDENFVWVSFIVACYMSYPSHYSLLLTVTILNEDYELFLKNHLMMAYLGRNML